MLECEIALIMLSTLILFSHITTLDVYIMLNYFINIVLRSAARLIGGIPKFGHVSQYMLDVLHWLPAEQRIAYRIASLVWRCLVGLAPVYLRELCCPPLSAMSSRSLR